MKLTGILEYSLGGFLTLRGYAKIGDLAKISVSDRNFQRELIPEHQEDLERFLSNKKYLFFPELIFGVELFKMENAEKYGELSKSFYESINLSKGFKSMKFQYFRLSYSNDRMLTVYIDDEKQKILTRIDGNHRLAAVEELIQDKPSIGDLLTPFSLIIFDNDDHKKSYSRVLFNNINSKAVPIELEHNIKLILKDDKNYSDETLKNDPSFGWAYYITRKIYNELDFTLLPHIENSFKDEKGRKKTASTLLSIIEFLFEEKRLKEEDKAKDKFKKALSEINALYSQNKQLEDTRSGGILGAFLYYELSGEPKLKEMLADWVIENHLTNLKSIPSSSIIKIFDSILTSKERTIFVSMPFTEDMENHYTTMKNVVKEINKEYKLKTKLTLKRVDWFVDGTSYEITSKILDLIDKSGYLIADLTSANPNVYHEVGYLMGKNKALGKKSYSNFLLILQTNTDGDVNVGFNLRGLKQIRFTDNEKLHVELKKNILKFYRLKERSAP